jgi:hypothetical protein
VPSSGVQTLVHWSLASSSSGVRRYDLQVSVDGAGYVGIGLATASTARRWVTLAPGHRYTFRARAVDRHGHAGPWKSVGPARGAIVADGSAQIVYRGGWRVAGAAGYLGGKAHYTRVARATAALRYRGASVAVIGPVGPRRGRSAVYIDGSFAGTINQFASTFGPRRVLFVRNLPNGTHTIVIKALGTSGRPMVAIDAIETLVPG